MSEISIEDVIEDLNVNLMEEISALVEKIRLAKDPLDGVDLLANAVSDGTTEIWFDAMHMASTLEDLINESS